MKNGVVRCLLDRPDAESTKTRQLGKASNTCKVDSRPLPPDPLKKSNIKIAFPNLFYYIRGGRKERIKASINKTAKGTVATY